MRRTLFAILVAAACGGSQKPPVPPTPLPEAKADPAPDAKPEVKPETKPEPPAPAGPLDVTVPAPTMSVKLVSPGKGKREALKFTPKAGGKQQVELALDFAEKQQAPAELGGDSENAAPTVLLTGDAEVRTVDPAGKAEYVVTVSNTDVHDATNKVPAETLEKFKHAASSLQGLTISSTLANNGGSGDVKLHIEKPKAESEAAVDLVRMTLPTLPMLPTEPVGVGAKWQVTKTTKIVDKVDVTQTTDYELTAHKGNTWTIKGTTKVTGGDQDVGGAKLSKIGGSGNVEVALVDGALYPAMKSSVDSGFSVTATGPDPASGAQKTVTLTIGLKQAAQITPK